MGKVLNGLWILIACWLLITPWLGWETYDAPSRYATTGAGAVILIMAVLQFTRNTWAGESRWMDWLVLVAGAVLLLGGVVYGVFPGLALPSAIVCGLLVVLTAWIAVHIPKPGNARMFSREGQTLMEMNSLFMDSKKGIGIKGKMMGTMPNTIFVGSEEVWKLLALLTPAVLLGVIGMILLPGKRSR